MKVFSMRSIRFIILILISTCFTSIAQQTIEVYDDTNYLIGKDIDIYIDETNTLGVNQVITKTFNKVETDIVNVGNTNGTLWMRFKLHSLDPTSVYIELAHPLLDKLVVYERYFDEDATEYYSGGFEERFDDRPITNQNWLFDIILPPNVTKEIIVEARSGYPMMVPVRVASTNKYEEYAQKINLFWGLYIGVILFSLLYNLFIFISVRERAYFYYVLYILFSVLFYLGLQGFDYMFLWPEAGFLNKLLPVSICITNVAIILFTFRFLQINKTNKVIYYIGIILIVLFVLLAFINFLLPYPIAVGLAQLLSMVSSLYYLIVGFISWYRKVPSAKYFVLAWTLFLVFAMIYLLTINNVLPSNFFTMHCIFIGHMTEVLLLSFSLAARINWLTEQNDNKQEQLIVQLQENDRIKTQANLELEQKVKERTYEVVDQKNEAIRQRERSDQLLLNILPAETAKELKETGVAKSSLLESITVLFTDIVDFSHFAETLNSQDLVYELNECFSGFDEIISRHNLEKIKTIGDSYMVAGGLPAPNNTHASDIIEAAFEIQEFMEKLKIEKEKEGKEAFEIRLGIHTGPVVAGVVGVKKFAYDIWGKTVNVANRMEQTGEAGKINISSATHAKVKDQYNFTYRGKVMAKGVGEIDMYFVDSKIKL